MRPSSSLLETVQSSLKHAANSINTNTFIKRATPEDLAHQGTRVSSPLKTGSMLANLALASLENKQVAVKDNISTYDFPTTCGSKGLQSYTSPFDATVVSRIRAVGALISGKTNLDEFGMGSHSTHSAFGAVHNPRTGYSAGGSSGGSAVAVASGECAGALGTDTGGSVRLPAAFNGVYGFKPSYGMISRWGVVPYANSLDTVGFLGNELDLVLGLFEASRGYDSQDPTSVDPKTLQRLQELLSKRESAKSVRIGVPRECIIHELFPAVRGVWLKLLKSLQRKGHSIQLVSLPTTIQALSAYYVLAPAEASSNLAKYDNVRYGNKQDSDEDASSVLYSIARRKGLGDEVRRRILLGSYSLSAEAIDNYFVQAQKIRRLMKDDFDRAFNMPNITTHDHPSGYDSTGVDCILCPTAPTLAPALDQLAQQSPLEAYASDVFTVPASLSGIPAISIPFECTDLEPYSPDQPPHVGMQVMTQYGDDYHAFEIARLVGDCREEVESG